MGVGGKGVVIPRFLVEFFLLGRTHRDALDRYTQDGGIVADVWLAFAADRTNPQRVLAAPTRDASAVVLGHTLHKAIAEYRKAYPNPKKTKSTQVSPLENFVALTIYFDELLRIVLPFTSWWHRRGLSALRSKALYSGMMLVEKLEKAILIKLGHKADIAIADEDPETTPDRRIIQAAPMAALIGVFMLAEENPAAFAKIQDCNERIPDLERRILAWIHTHAQKIAKAARNELSRQFETFLLFSQSQMQAQTKVRPSDVPELIQRVFLDREAALAASEANCTIKADAATRVFDVSCRGITWAVIDSGIATNHPAFEDHNARDPRGVPIVPKPSRVRATFDFTKIQWIRNFDLIEKDTRTEVINDVIKELKKLPGRQNDKKFESMARSKLKAIAQQLEAQIPPDWNLIEYLIRIPDTPAGAQVPSDHGTHVAGILAADWRRINKRTGQEEIVFQGVCPDIDLYDLRVIKPGDPVKNTEFAVLAALEYVQFVNARAGSNGPVIYGVNISMSIPYEVSNYGCGATPVCVACDRLVGAGVVVIAAAGNRGWNEMEIGFGNFVFCSITDPGNARDVITVGSTHGAKPHIYGVSYFSSRGPTGDGRVKPDLVAPGEAIRGPIRNDADDELDGTSMAAPFVSGAAAMLISRHRELIGDPDRIKQILCSSATDLGREKYFQGHGLVDVLRAMQSI